VISHGHQIEAGLDGGHGDLVVGGVPIRVERVGVQVGDVLVDQGVTAQAGA